MKIATEEMVVGNYIYPHLTEISFDGNLHRLLVRYLL